MLHAGGQVPDPAAIYTARRAMGLALAQRLADALPGMMAGLADAGRYAPDALGAGRRALRMVLLALQTRLDGGVVAAAIYAGADNMTEQAAALACLLDAGAGQAELAGFAARWAGDANVMDKWFALQVAMAAPDRMAGVAADLAAHPQFMWKNPNRFRAVLGPASAHHAGFHAASGAGYRFVADWLIRLDPVNPQTTARMSTAFETWPRYDAGRQALMRGEIARMAAMPGLSRDLGEMLMRMGG